MNFPTIFFKKPVVQACAAFRDLGSAKAQPTPSAQPRPKGTSPVAVWKANSETGLLECHWVLDADAMDSWQSQSFFERVGMVLSVMQQQRNAIRAHRCEYLKHL